MFTYISLDKQINDDDDEKMIMDLLSSKENLSEECTFHYDMERLRINMCEILNEREIEVLEYRFGFKTGKPKTLEEIGKMQNCKKERILF